VCPFCHPVAARICQSSDYTGKTQIRAVHGACRAGHALWHYSVPRFLRGVMIKLRSNPRFAEFQELRTTHQGVRATVGGHAVSLPDGGFSNAGGCGERFGCGATRWTLESPGHTRRLRKHHRGNRFGRMQGERPLRGHREPESATACGSGGKIGTHTESHHRGQSS